MGAPPPDAVLALHAGAGLVGLHLDGEADSGGLLRAATDAGAFALDVSGDLRSDGLVAATMPCWELAEPATGLHFPSGGGTNVGYASTPHARGVALAGASVTIEEAGIYLVRAGGRVAAGGTAGTAKILYVVHERATVRLEQLESMQSANVELAFNVSGPVWCAAGDVLYPRFFNLSTADLAAVTTTGMWTWSGVMLSAL